MAHGKRTGRRKSARNTKWEKNAWISENHHPVSSLSSCVVCRDLNMFPAVRCCVWETFPPLRKGLNQPRCTCNVLCHRSKPRDQASAASHVWFHLHGADFHGIVIPVPRFPRDASCKRTDISWTLIATVQVGCVTTLRTTNRL